MERKRKWLYFAALLVLAAPLVLTGNAGAAATAYLSDGAVQSSTSGGWDLPSDLGWCFPSMELTTKGSCRSLRLSSLSTKTACTTANPAGITLTGTAPTVYNAASNKGRWASACSNSLYSDHDSCIAAGATWGGFYACNNVYIDATKTTQDACNAANGSWSSSTSKCSVKYTDAAACTASGGTMSWSNNSETVGMCTGNWVFANSYTGNDQCLRCHNANYMDTSPQANKQSYLKTGHKNMLRKVTAGKNWAGPNGQAYTTDGTYSNNLPSVINWTKGTVSIGGVDKVLFYIYGDWMAPLPSLAYDTSTGGDGSKTSYTCGACHTTGWSNINYTCTDSKYTKQADCETAGKVWTKVGLCSDSTKKSSSECAAAGATWVDSTGVTGNAGAEPAASFPGIKSGITGKWDQNGIMCSRCHSSTSSGISATATYPTKATCLAAGYNWTDSTYITQAACEAAGNTWSTTNSVCSDAKCTVTGTHNSNPTAGDRITNLCFGCHQSLSSTYTVDGTTGVATAKVNLDPTMIPIGVSHGAAWGREFNGHVLGNSFLNSVHGKFTGTVTPNKLGKYDIVAGGAYASAFSQSADGSCSTGESKTSAECTAAGGTWTSAAGSCTTCHDVHQSIVTAAGAAEPLRRECTTCHTDKADKIFHASGPGTPLASKYPCEVCHMPTSTADGMPMHLWRINTDPNYDTFPTAAEFYGGTCSNSSYTNKADCVDATKGNGTWTATTMTRAAKTAPDGSYTNAVWVDLDAACGQCHGGSAGPGGTANGAKYMSKAVLSKYAQQIHGGAAKTEWITADFTIKKTSKSKTIEVNASSTTYPSGSTCSYAWDFGDGSTGDGASATHTYTSSGTMSVTLTVSADGYNSNSLTRKVVIGNNSKPVADMQVDATDRDTSKTGLQVYPLDPVTVTDKSTDASGDLEKVSVNWGDGTSETLDTLGGSVTHSYSTPGKKAIMLTAVDQVGLKATKKTDITVVALTGTISGNVQLSSANVAGAQVVLKTSAGKKVKATATNSKGNYSFAKVPGGNYSIVAVKGTCSATGTVSISKSVTSPTVGLTLVCK